MNANHLGNDYYIGHLTTSVREGLTDVIVSLGIHRLQRLGWAFSSAIGILGLSETGTGDLNHVDRNDSLEGR